MSDVYPKEWTPRTINDCASDEPYSTQIGPFGNKIRASIYTAFGSPVLRGTQVNTPGRFHDEDFVFIDPAYAENELSKFICEAGDVILCHKGTLGKIGIVPQVSKYPQYIMGNSMMKVRCDEEKLVPLYLYYWLCSHRGQHHLFSRVSQVGVPQIQRPLSSLREAELCCPPIPEQRSIASVLGALDDKIELNRRVNKTLEDMAAAIFKAWFVDFEPVHAKANGAKSFPGMPPKVFAALPTAFINSELGQIPEGWEVKKFGDVMELAYGKALKADNRREGAIPVYGSNGRVGWHDEALVPDAGIIVGRKGNPGMVNWSSTAFFPIDTTFYVRPLIQDYSLKLLYYQLKAANLARLGADSAVPGVNRNAVYGESCLTPSSIMQIMFENAMSPLWTLSSQLKNETQTLSETRDTLLPKLLSGEVRVGDLDLQEVSA